MPPIPHPRWYSNIAYDSAPSVLKAALGRVRLPAVGVAGLKSLPLARRVGASFQRPLECIRTSYRSNFIGRCPSGPRSTFTEYALPTGRGLTCGDGWLVDFWRCIAVCVGQALLYQQFGDLFAVARRFRAFAEHQLLGTRRPPRRLAFDARSLLQARTSS